MTKETSTPESQEPQTAEAPTNTTVFSDGSTFDYENGYQSNGAPVATRDRTENPRIVKSHKFVTVSRVAGILVLLLFIGAISALVHIGISHYQRDENNNAIKDGINNSGQVKVVQIGEEGVLVNRPDGGIFKCDVSMISKDSVPTGLVFCSPGGPSTFSIPLPHDPSNVFYTAQAKDK